HRRRIQARDAARNEIAAAAHALAGAAARAGRTAGGLVRGDRALDDREGRRAGQPGARVEAVVVNAAAEAVAAVAARAPRAADRLVAGERAARDGEGRSKQVGDRDGVALVDVEDAVGVVAADGQQARARAYDVSSV